MNYEIMQETVDKLCKDMLDNPQSYTVGTWTFNKIGCDTEYWRADSATSIWDGNTIIQVFSHKQGRQLADALNFVLERHGSIVQQKIIENVNNTIDSSHTCMQQDKTPWWKRLFS